MSRRQRLAPLAAVLALCLVVPACGKNKVTKANFDQVKEGMTLAEVEKLLGKGTQEDLGGGGGVANQFGVDVSAPPTVGGGTIYTWERGKASIKVSFSRDGKVTQKAGAGF